MRATLLTAVFIAVRLGQALPTTDIVLSERGPNAQSPLRTNAPAGSVWGEVGHLTDPKPITRNIRAAIQADACTTQFQCSEKCKAVSRCKSFSFDEEAAVCRFFSSPISEQGIKHNYTNKTVFYDAACFRCISCTPNLINGGWESGQLSPWVTFTHHDTEKPTSLIYDLGNNSMYSLELLGSSPPHHSILLDLYITQYVTLCPNGADTTYNIDFDWMFRKKRPNVGGIGWSIGSSPSHTPFANPLDPAYTSGVWYHLSDSFSSANASSSTLEFWVGYPGRKLPVFFDDIRLSLAS